MQRNAPSIVTTLVNILFLGIFALDRLHTGPNDDTPEQNGCANSEIGRAPDRLYSIFAVRSRLGTNMEVVAIREWPPALSNEMALAQKIAIDRPYVEAIRRQDKVFSYHGEGA